MYKPSHNYQAAFLNFVFVIILGCSDDLMSENILYISPVELNSTDIVDIKDDDVWSNLFISLVSDNYECFPITIKKTQNTKIYNYKILSKVEEKFYKKYVGVYFEIDMLDYHKIKRHIYELHEYDTDWGNTYFIGKWPRSILYNEDKNVFYLASDSGIDLIKDIKKFKLPNNWVRICGPKNTNEYFIKLIQRVNADSKATVSSSPINEVQRAEAITVVKEFFNAIRSADISTATFLCSDSGVTVNDPASQALLKDDYYFKKLIESIKLNYEYIYYPSLRWSILINVYFSEDQKSILSRFPDAVLIEFRSSDSSNYMNIVLVPENDIYKIAFIRSALDIE